MTGSPVTPVHRSATAPAQPREAPVLQLRGISKSFGATRALDGVDFEVRAGEVHALLGQNGSGKSTLMKVAYGEVPPDQGEVLLDGAAAAFRSPHDARSAGVAMVAQEIPAALELSVAENVLLGALPRRGPWVNWAEVHRRAADVLAQVGSHVDPRAELGRLAPHDRQTVAIARALAQGSRLLILDEPTSSLSVREVDRLFALLRQLASRGVAMVLITQRLQEIAAIADRVTVLRDGRKVAERDRATGLGGVEELVTGQALAALRSAGGWTGGRPLLAVRGLRDGHALDGVDLTVGAGEIVGVSGLVGCGRTELLRALFGAHDRPHSGEIAVDGRRVDKLTPRTAIRHGIAMVTADRRREGLLLDRSVHDNLMMVRRRQSSLRPLPFRAERSQVADLIRDLRIRTPTPLAAVGTLSGGNQQKVVLGKWLALRPSFLILDEPTRGVDVAAKADFYRVVTRLAAEGVGVLVSSVDDSELLEVCHRIVVLRRGRIVADVPASSTSEGALLLAASGMEDPS
ncbi:sugar ABC transporter ATP-binding protein [Geodermatophilus sp. CPCC 206100]|uniref:sugar ABC transporter ATP-binding protein n=1 Tax=Geodermatophilus sp. CPCC 206100 TaxID=3020054 RepID=UPI003AFF6C2B